MYLNARLLGLFGISAGLSLALPSSVLAQITIGPSEYHKQHAHDAERRQQQANEAAQPEPEPLTTAEIKQLKTSKKQADALYQAGLKYEKAGALKNAQISYYKALALRQKVYGKGDSGIYILTARLGEVALKQKDWEYADQCFKELMKSQNKAHGPGDYDTVPILLKLSQVEAGRKLIPAQIGYLERALTLQERKKGANAPECLMTRISLLNATINDGDYRDAEERLNRALSVEKDKGNTNSKEYLQLLKGGSKVMKALNKQTEAADFDRQASELEARLAQKPAAPANSTTATIDTKPADTKAAPADAKPSDTKPAPGE
jgi:hypothetical protein